MTEIINDKVSVCIPAYNAGKYLKYMLDSVITQSYRNLEIIVSDNASIDNTRAIVESYMSIDRRIRYRRNDKNIGYVGNIEKAVAASCSEIIAIFHADDVYEQTIIERELAVLNRRNDVSAVFTKYRHFYGEEPENRNETIESWEKMLKYDTLIEAFYGDLDDFIPVLLEFGNPFCCPSLMTRKRDYLSLGGFSDKYPSNEDLELWIKYLQKNKELAILGSTLVNYRHSPEQGSSYWESRLALPVFYQVIDEMLMPYINDNYASRRIYNLRKTFNLFELASRIPLSDPRHRIFIKNSLKVFRFPLFTDKGMMQRFPSSYEGIKTFCVNGKKSFRQRFPKIYKGIKVAYHIIVDRF